MRNAHGKIMEDLEFEETKLTPTQWAFYRLLMSSPDHWFTKEEICEAVKTYKLTDDIRNKCPEIGADRIAINENQRVDKYITLKNNCFKIATVDEYKEERSRHIRRLQNEVNQIKAADYKFERHGQCKLFNNVLDELKEDNEQFHETFVNMHDLFEEDPPKEINGVKVFTRVLIKWNEQVAIRVTAKRIIIDYDIRSAKYYAKVELANGAIIQIHGIEVGTYALVDFLERTIYKDFRREIVS